MKRFLRILAIVALCLGGMLLSSALAVEPSQTSGTCGDNLQWSIAPIEGEDGKYELTITGYGAMADYSSSSTAPWYGFTHKVNLPEGLTYIGKYAFYYGQFTEIEIPSTVTSIGQFAFQYAQLRELTLPNSVTSVGSWAFSKNSNLEKVTLPDSLTAVSSSMFIYCGKLKEVRLPAHLTKIGQYAFSECTSLEGLDLPAGLTTVESEAFQGCTKLKDIKLPNSVNYVGFYAFAGCKSLTEIDIPYGVEWIGVQTFYNCTALKRITIPESVYRIWNNAFNGCTSLTEIVLPSGLTQIDESAFYNCTALKRVNLPSGLTQINQKAFYNCSSLGGDLVIPSGMTTISNYCFYKCTGISSVEIPSSVTTIAGYAFQYCNMKLHIPDSVTTLSNYCVGYNCEVYCNSTSKAADYCRTYVDTYVFLDQVDIDTVRTVNVYPTELRVACGETASIEWSVFPSFDSPTVTWTNLYTSPYVPSVMDILDNRTLRANRPGRFNTVVSCGDAGQYVTVTSYVRPTGFEIPSEIWLLAGGEATLPVTGLTPEDADWQLEMAWSSSDEGVAVVDGAGHVQAMSAVGEAVITAVADGRVVRQCTVHVCAPVSTVSFEEELARVPEGGSAQIEASVTTGDQVFINQLVSFESLDETVATVDAEGLVTAVAPGETAIIATAQSGASGSIYVRVVCTEHESVIDPAVEATCAQTGLTEGSHCPVCGEVIEVQQTVPKLPHTEVSDPAVEATCAQAGLTAGSHCSVCGEVVVAQQTVPKLPHTEVSDPAVEATCVQAGLTAGSHCSVCGEVIVAQQNVPPTGKHRYVIDEAVAPTCTASGLTTGTHCTVCGEVFVEQQIVPALGHDWGEIEYEWSADGCTVTASRVCGRDAAHIERETVDVIRRLEAPGETEAGALIFETAAFENEAFERQVREEPIPALCDMKVLRLPESLDEIGEEAFAGLNCEAVIVPEGCASIGERAFAGCEKLRYVKLPGAGIQIAGDAFEGCPLVLFDDGGNE